MNRPETMYAMGGDVHIAYQITGTGPVDLVRAPGTVSLLELELERPEAVRNMERMSSFCCYVRFDKRGTGMSDRVMEAATLEERIDDIRAVMDAAGSKEAVIFGASEGGFNGLPVRCDISRSYKGIDSVGRSGTVDTY